MVCAKIRVRRKRLLSKHTQWPLSLSSRYHAAPLGLGKFLLYRWQAPTTSFPAYGLRSDFVTYTICPRRRREINFMQNNWVGQPRRVNVFTFLNILWGCVMLPLWTLGVYYSFKEGPIEIQGLVMSSAALVVSLCLIVSPLFRRNAAITALMFSCILQPQTLSTTPVQSIR